MADEVLTKTFEFMKFPKPVKKEKVNFRDGGWFKKPPTGKPKKLIGKQASTLKFGKERLPPIKALKLKADKVFSLFIRSRDNNKCVLCNSHANIQCGHLIKRGKMATRYDEINCSALCSSCNYKDNFEPWHYATWFIKKYGPAEFEKLVDRSKKLLQVKRGYLMYIVARYGSNTKET